MSELKFMNEKFVCPHCNTMAKQEWIHSSMLSKIAMDIYRQGYFNYRQEILDYKQEAIEAFLNNMAIKFPKQFENYLPSELAISICHSCEDFALWVNKQIVYPSKMPTDSPNSDMNDDIQDIYNEAAMIVFHSPKGAAALLRLALQKLLIQLGEKGKDINNDIAILVSKGLSPKIQQALDFVRVVGNESVHPGSIDLDDNIDVALALFKLLNFITEEMITKPKEIENLYENILPQNKKDAITKRDGQE